MKALIKDNKVLQIEIQPFPVHKSMIWVDCPDNCNNKWTYVNSEFIPPPDKTIDERKIELASLRFEKETAGIIVDGFKVDTDRESQNMLLMADFYSKKTGGDIHFKGKEKWMKVSAANFDDIISAVANHVQACFIREQELSAALECDINTDITTGWPVYK